MTAPEVTTEDLSYLLDTQRELEEEAIGTGVHRFKKQLEAARKGGRGSHSGSTKYLLGTCLSRMVLLLEANAEQREGIPGPRPLIHTWAARVGFDEFAYLTAKTILSTLFQHGNEVRLVALGISALCFDEMRYRRFKLHDKDGFRRALSRMNTKSYTHMSRSLLAIMGKNEIMQEVDMSDLVLSNRDRTLLGVQAIEVFMQANPEVVFREAIRDPSRGTSMRKTRMFLKAGQETLDWINKRDNRLADMHPAQLPMVVPPMPWSHGSDGGYRYALNAKWKLVRGVQACGIKDREAMPVVYESLNAIQNTPWKINTRVLEVAEALIKLGGARAGLPAFEPVPIPKRTPDMDTKPESLKAWKKLAHAAHEENYQRKLDCIAPMRVAGTARRFVEHSAIWFPHTLDFRGRVYPQCEHLSPQGNDFGKAVLQFAEGTPMGSGGASFLALHLANCIDKLDGVKANTMTREERVSWVQANTPSILAAAADPFAHSWWMDADSPFMTLAACYAWTDFHDAKYDPKHVCALPVAQDGSCNGLQHLSAMFRDEVGAVSVNVAPNQRPKDIYRAVADFVKTSLEAQAVDNQYARLWLNSGLVDRSLAKSPTMTFAYGSKKFGFGEQIRDTVVSNPLWKTGELRTLFRDELGDRTVLGAACSLLASEMWDALGKTVTKAQQAMDWMQSTASGISRTGKAVEWTVPLTGFVVRQNYFIPNLKQIKTVLAGQAYHPAVYDEGAEVNASKQRSAIAPNIVHSLDAAALMLTVSQAHSLGVRSFGMVHDSYATTPGEAETMYRCTRDSFFRLYDSGNVATDISAQLKAQWSEKEQDEFPEMPEMGRFDLSGVLESEYFFC
jgi:DNA-directed RNA polymerase